jgi:enoyl-CoA hydratase/carnithine racemase
MEFKDLRFEKENRVGTITLNRPERLNALGAQTTLEICDACEKAIGDPDIRVVVITGDGSVGLNFAEFDTAVRHRLPIVVVVNNDQAWGMCKHEQVVRYGDQRIVANGQVESAWPVPGSPTPACTATSVKVPSPLLR